LLRGLPPTSLTARAVHGDAAGWGVHEELLAGVVDRLGSALYLLQAVAGVANPEHPPAVPRPTDAERVAATEAPPKMSTKEEIRAFFGMPGTETHYSEN
jgi:hypothetical protein